VISALQGLELVQTHFGDKFRVSEEKPRFGSPLQSICAFEADLMKAAGRRFLPLWRDGGLAMPTDTGRHGAWVLALRRV